MKRRFPCPGCRGTGTVLVYGHDSQGAWSREEICTDCDGEGTI